MLKGDAKHSAVWRGYYPVTVYLNPKDSHTYKMEYLTVTTHRQPLRKTTVIDAELAGPKPYDPDRFGPGTAV